MKARLEEFRVLADIFCILIGIYCLRVAQMMYVLFTEGFTAAHEVWQETKGMLGS